jgi:hypothetical protein
MGGMGRKGRGGEGKKKRESKREVRGGRGLSPQIQKPNSACVHLRRHSNRKIEFTSIVRSENL